jgi:hypothetical protein
MVGKVLDACEKEMSDYVILVCFVYTAIDGSSSFDTSTGMNYIEKHIPYGILRRLL